MPKKKSTSDFVNELKEISPDINVLEPYINSKTKLKCECGKCGNQWYVEPSKLLIGRGCPNCASKKNGDRKRYTKEEFAKRVHAIHPSIEIIGEYINSITKIEVYCNECGNRWRVVPSSLLSGTGCPRCNKRYRRNTEEFIEELRLINPNIEVLGQYKSAHEKVLVRCNRCKNKWEAVANGLLKGNDCPKCSHSQTSVIEQILYTSLCRILGEDKVRNRDRLAINKELDIYVPDLSLAIEFGAWYWHSKRIENDRNKEILCNSQGIHLITIYEGTPVDFSLKELPNVVCFPEIISSEKGFTSIKKFIISLCNDYSLNSEVIVNDWDNIIRAAQQESRKKDEGLFVKELAQSNPNIEYISDYSGSKNSVHVKCKICGHEWFASSSYELLNGRGCPKCANIKRSEAQRMSSEEFRMRLSIINPDLEPLETYKGHNISILCRCKICGTEWNATPGSIIYRKRNCPNCSPVTRKTDEVFREELKTVTNDIIPLETYKNRRTKILVTCKICGYEWHAKPSDLLRGSGCPKCSNRITLSQEEFISRVKRSNPYIEITGKYIDSKTTVKCRCLICQYEWNGLPYNLVKGSGCAKCAGTLQLTNETFSERLAIMNPNIVAKEVYKNTKTKLLCKCCVCGNEWHALPHNLLKGHGCPKCKAEKIRKSKMQKVLCVETNQIFDSISDAKNATGITTISDCLHNRIKTAGKFHWKYVDDMK